MEFQDLSKGFDYVLHIAVNAYAPDIYMLSVWTTKTWEMHLAHDEDATPMFCSSTNRQEFLMWLITKTVENLNDLVRLTVGGAYTLNVHTKIPGVLEACTIMFRKNMKANMDMVQA